MLRRPPCGPSALGLRGHVVSPSGPRDPVTGLRISPSGPLLVVGPPPPPAYAITVDPSVADGLRVASGDTYLVWGLSTGVPIPPGAAVTLGGAPATLDAGVWTAVATVPALTGDWTVEARVDGVLAGAAVVPGLAIPAAAPAAWEPVSDTVTRIALTADTVLDIGPTLAALGAVLWVDAAGWALDFAATADVAVRSRLRWTIGGQTRRVRIEVVEADGAVVVEVTDYPTQYGEPEEVVAIVGPDVTTGPVTTVTGDAFDAWVPATMVAPLPDVTTAEASVARELLPAGTWAEWGYEISVSATSAALGCVAQLSDATSDLRGAITVSTDLWTGEATGAWTSGWTLADMTQPPGPEYVGRRTIWSASGGTSGGLQWNNGSVVPADADPLLGPVTAGGPVRDPVPILGAPDGAQLWFAGVGTTERGRRNLRAYRRELLRGATAAPECWVFIGSSILALNAWTALQASLAPGDQAILLAVSGSTVAAALGQYRVALALLPQLAASYSVRVVCDPANIYNSWAVDGIDPDVSAAALRPYLTRLGQFAAPVQLIQHTRVPAAAPSARLQRVSRELSVASGVAYTTWLDVAPPSDFPDELHPNLAGATAMVGRIRETAAWSLRAA